MGEPDLVGVDCGGEVKLQTKPTYFYQRAENRFPRTSLPLSRCQATHVFEEHVPEEPLVVAEEGHPAAARGDPAHAQALRIGFVQRVPSEVARINRESLIAHRKDEGGVGLAGYEVVAVLIRPTRAGDVGVERGSVPLGKDEFGRSCDFMLKGVRKVPLITLCFNFAGCLPVSRMIWRGPKPSDLPSTETSGRLTRPRKRELGQLGAERRARS